MFVGRAVAHRQRTVGNQRVQRQQEFGARGRLEEPLEVLLVGLGPVLRSHEPCAGQCGALRPLPSRKPVSKSFHFATCPLPIACYEEV